MSWKGAIIFVLIGLISIGLATGIYLNVNTRFNGGSYIDIRRFGGYLDLQNYISLSTLSGNYLPFYYGGFIREAGYPVPLAAESKTLAASAEPGVDYSITNVQVEGIDEADYVKTDGKYIYFKNGSNVIIAKAYPPEEHRILSLITLTNRTIKGLYLYGDKLIILGVEGGYIHILEYVAEKTIPATKTENSVRPAIYPPPKPKPPTSTIYIYDVSNPSNPSLIHYINITGTLFQSRLMKNILYLIIREYTLGENNTVILPSYTIDGENTTVSPEDIYYLTGLHEYGYQYTIIFSIDLDTWRHSTTTILSGSTSTIYMSYTNMYLAQPIFTSNVYKGAFLEESLQKTAVIKIGIDGLTTTPKNIAVVDGYINEQFQMDEYKGYLRVSTHVMKAFRSNDVYRVETYTNIYVLNSNMEIVGSVTGLGKSEQLYATRFMGDYAYLVTFRRIDPLFVIDLSTPEEPRVVGELKIPGFSDMLQPIGKNMLIGIGYIRIKGINKLKISLFNVTNPEEPIEISNITLGNWSNSEATYNHKAIMITPLNGVFGIPITTYETTTITINKSGIPTTITTQIPIYKYIVLNASGGELKILKEIDIKNLNKHKTDQSIDHIWIWIEYIRGIYIKNYIYIVSPQGIYIEKLQ